MHAKVILETLKQVKYEFGIVWGFSMNSTLCACSLTPIGSQSPHRRSLTPPPQQDGEKNTIGGKKKLVGSDEDKEIIHELLSR